MENANRLQEKRVLRASQKCTGRENVCSDKIDTNTGDTSEISIFATCMRGKNDYDNWSVNFPSLLLTPNNV